jgi:hypothetical protein
MPAATAATIGSAPVTPLTRRSFLVASAGLVVFAACGGSDDDSGAGPSGDIGGDDGGGTVLVRFFNDGVQAAGTPQRLPFGLGNKDGVVTEGGPESLTFEILDEAGTVVTEVQAPRHADQLPRPYWPVMLSLAQPGLYTARAKIGGNPTSGFTIKPAAEVAMPKPGDKLVPVDTPTTADARGVTPICTRTPACPLHAISLRDAIAAGKPVALLIGTPAYCQTGICGPVLDVLLDRQSRFPGVTMVHAEVYVNPDKALSSSATSTGSSGADLGEVTPAVKAYELAFEPVLYLARSDGTIDSRLDNIYDGAELDAALQRLS